MVISHFIWSSIQGFEALEVRRTTESLWGICSDEGLGFRVK